MSIHYTYYVYVLWFLTGCRREDADHQQVPLLELTEYNNLLS